MNDRLTQEFRPFIVSKSGASIVLGSCLVALGSHLNAIGVSIGVSIGGLILLIGGLALRFAYQELRYRDYLQGERSARSALRVIESELRETRDFVQRLSRAHQGHTDELAKFSATVSEVAATVRSNHEDVQRALDRQNVVTQAAAVDLAGIADRFTTLERSFATLNARRAWTSTEGGLGQHAELALSGAMTVLSTKLTDSEQA